MAALAPEAHALLQDPKARDILEQADRAAVADLIGEVEFSRLFGQNGSRGFHSQQRPGAGAQVSPARLVGRRDSRNRGTRVVRASGDDLDRSESGLGLEFRSERADHGAGGDDLREDRLWKSEAREERACPVHLRGIKQLGRAGQRGLGHRISAEKVIHRITDQQEAVGELQDLGTHQQIRVELAERVDRHELDAGGRVDLLTGDIAETLVGSVGSLIAVLVGGRQERLGALHQRIVDTPGIGTERADRQIARPCLPQPLNDFSVEMQEVPASRSLDHHRSVGEAVNLLERQSSFPKRAEHDAAALGTEINREIVGVGGHGERGLD